MRWLHTANRQSRTEHRMTRHEETVPEQLEVKNVLDHTLPRSLPHAPPDEHRLQYRDHTCSSRSSHEEDRGKNRSSSLLCGQKECAGKGIGFFPLFMNITVHTPDYTA